MPDMTPGQLIERFYNEVWNQWNEAAASEILGPKFKFRGSLGRETAGIEEFLDYTRSIRAAFPDFHNDIEALIVEGDSAAARLTYTGTHRGVALSIEATGRPIRYAGAAFFTCHKGLIEKAWVLGDLDSLKQQLTES